jgi:hypothetical protein
MLLIERAKHELTHNDVTMCILLSALAVEAQMAYLFFKWRGLDSEMLPAGQPPHGRKQLEDEWAGMRSIGTRLEKLSQLLTKKAFDEFARLKFHLLKPALADYDPAGSMRDFFQDGFFEKRNRIAHYGEIDLEKPDGEHCFSSATALLSLLRAMDGTRYDLTFPKR